MQKPLAPLLSRANIPNKLRQIRSEIAVLQDAKALSNGWDYRGAARLQRLQKLLVELQKEHTFLIVDNT